MLGGIVTDFIPSRLLFPIGLVTCGLTTCLLPLYPSTWWFCLVWFLNGIGHGLELPTAGRLTKQASSANSFATNWAFVLTAVNIVGVANPIVSTFLGNLLGWRTTVLISGIITATSGVMVYIYFNHTSLQINQDAKSKSDNLKSTLRARDLFIYPVLWIVVINR